MKAFGKDEVVPLTGGQEKELEELIEKINSALKEEYGFFKHEYGITVDIDKNLSDKIVEKIKKMYDDDLGNKGWKVEFERGDYRSDGAYFRFTPKWKLK